MYQFVLMIHIFVTVAVIALVLVQQGKGATIGASFGSGASQTVFGSRGSGSFLLRLTIGFMMIFFATSITLNYLASKTYAQPRQVVLPVTLPPDNSNTGSPVSTSGQPTLPVTTNSIPTTTTSGAV